MAEVTERRCDRCAVVLGTRRLTVTVNYHHPRTLDLCDPCEREFTVWLGKHPLWDTTLEHIAKGGASGDGYPTRERAQEALDE